MMKSRATLAHHAARQATQGITGRLGIHRGNHGLLPFGQVIRPAICIEHRGDKGFTLVEVLVVVAVLGIVAAIVIMNITGFAGISAVNAANTEAHQVQTALIAYMEANHLSTANCTVGDGSEESEAIERYLLNPAQLQARYTVSDGRITDALAYPDGRWAGCSWDAEKGGWRHHDD